MPQLQSAIRAFASAISNRVSMSLETLAQARERGTRKVKEMPPTCRVGRPVPRSAALTWLPQLFTQCTEEMSGTDRREALLALKGGKVVAPALLESARDKGAVRWDLLVRDAADFECGDSLSPGHRHGIVIVLISMNMGRPGEAMASSRAWDGPVGTHAYGSNSVRAKGVPPAHESCRQGRTA